MDFTGQGGTIFPAGTTVNAYPPPFGVAFAGGAPPTSSAGSGTVGTDGKYTISGLTAGMAYRVGAQVSGTWRYSRIKLPTAAEAAEEAGTGGGSATTTLTWRYPGAIVVGAGVSPQTLPRAMILTGVTVALGTGPVGQNAVFDLNANGASIFADQATRPKILDGASSGSVSGLAVQLASGTALVPDIDQIGTTQPGTTLTVQATLVG